MLNDVVAVKPLDGYRVYLRFEDGVEGELDLSQLIEFTGMFATLRDQAEFRMVRVDAEAGTIVWPNGADLDPVLHWRRLAQPWSGMT
jgi:hypothetical protein